MKNGSPILLVFVAVSVQASVYFTPVTGERVLDGIKFPQLSFHENGREITYEQPRGWTYLGDANHISFTPPNTAQAQAEIAQAPLSAPQNFDEPTMKLLQDQVIHSLPADSHDVAVVS